MGLFKKKVTQDVDDAALAHEVAVVEAVLVNYAPGYRLPFGSPTRCPQCTSFGFVSAVNRSTGVTANSCFSCHLDWDITMRALKALEASRHVAGTQAAQRSGALWAGFGAPGSAPGDPVIDLTATSATRSDPLQLLLVEDNPDDAAMVEAILRPMMPHAVQIAHVATRHEGENAAKLGFDVVMLDLDLPESRGMATLRSFRDVCPEPPLCVCSGVDDIGIAWQGLAQQNLPKRELPRLVKNVAAGSRELLGLLHLTTTS
jgi:CheY-like chemotaxis protein